MFVVLVVVVVVDFEQKSDDWESWLVPKNAILNRFVSFVSFLTRFRTLCPLCHIFLVLSSA